MEYIARFGIIGYIVAIVCLAHGQEPYRGGCRDYRSDCLFRTVAAKDDGGYIPPDNGHPDCDPCLGSGTRYQ
ncbi:hypothetical protein [Nostoc sp. TCL240-02]|uniref:hypothetical protein n=1 Tax=Nostoc sp. TCL240-02 TaxID=2572090 RepID=UPI00157F81AA|nr:hypothetical protein [Nostoc sp. TCL240-02]QKQ75557.1 hypothetical protein FBB35_21735 [Nostoc sp. TCL240-02]